jgi:hypothetical protein
MHTVDDPSARLEGGNLFTRPNMPASTKLRVRRRDAISKECWKVDSGLCACAHVKRERSKGNPARRVKEVDHMIVSR